MKIFRRILTVVFVSLLLYSVLIILRHPYKAYYDSKDTFLYSKGSAPEEVRTEIVEQLHRFQEGYSQRDISRLEPFMAELFSENNILILGTMPQEILKNFERATVLVSSDWRTWGDCTFLMDNAHISTSGNVAWVSTIGYVKFDMSRFLVLPLRFSAVMVIQETDVWNFRYMHFHFDLDISSILVTLILLLIWLPVSLISLSVVTFRRLRKSDES